MNHAARLVFFQVLIFTSALALARTPTSAPLKNPVPSRSLDDAAISALKLAAAQSGRFEYGGCLYSQGGNFYFTEPATNGSEDDFNVGCEIPRGGRFMGIYHTHPFGAEKEISNPDIEIARRLGVKSYVGFLDQSLVMSFQPGRTRTYCRASGRDICPQGALISDGDVVGKL